MVTAQNIFNNILYCIIVLEYYFCLETFEVNFKDNLLVHKKTTHTNFRLDFTPKCYSCGSFYGLHYDLISTLPTVKKLSLDTQIIETVDGIDAIEAIFTFRHYSVCQKQEFINDCAEDILKYFETQLENE